MNHIHLSAETLVSLYKDQLVVLGDLPPETAMLPVSQAAIAQPETAVPIKKEGSAAYEWAFDGQNLKHITLLLSAPLTSKHTSFLANILKACRLTFDDTAIVNMKGEDISITDIKSRLKPAIILLFGIKPLDISLPVNFPPFKIQAYDSIQYLSVPELKLMVEESDNAKLLKSKLWLCLKELFQL